MINKILLQKHIDNKLVVVQKHPTADLYIYNYSPKVQYEKLWDEVTLITRGLILDSEMNYVSRPFGKFFNLEEHDKSEIPNLAFDVFMKLDGSFGEIYWLNDKPYIASRGSFTSEQALHATDVLYKKYSHLFDKLDRTATYIFEIIYPENTIVLNYNGLDDIILLTVIDIKTGEERLEDIGFPLVERLDGINDINKLKLLEETNKEGFVVRFKNGFRVKVKFDEYVRLHRIITGVSNVAIWEYLSEGKSFDELLEKVPDEFYNWVKKTASELTVNFNNILDECKTVFKELNTRKETALYFQNQKHPSVLFYLLDKKDPNIVIWKLIKPKFQKPFRND